MTVSLGRCLGALLVTAVSLAFGAPVAADGPSRIYSQQIDGGTVQVVGEWQDGTYRFASGEYSEERADGTVRVWKWEDGTYSVLFREYIEQAVDGVYLVRAWDDGSYSRQPIPDEPAVRPEPVGGLAVPNSAALASTPPQPAPARTPPAAKPQLTVLVDGLSPTGWSDSSADPGLTTLYAALGGQVEYFGYLSTQPLQASGASLAQRIHELQSQYDVRVAGFSLGGLVALEAIRQGARPSAVLTIDSPLQGRNMAAIDSVCSSVNRGALLLGAGAGAVAAATLGLSLPATAVAGGGLVYAVASARAAFLCDKSFPIRDDLARIYQNRSGWLQSLQPGLSAVKIGTVGNFGDCVYYAYLCMNSWGSSDVDDRFTQWLPQQSFLTQLEDYSAVGEHQNFGVYDVRPSHILALGNGGAIDDAARFLMQISVPNPLAPLVASPTPSATAAPDPRPNPTLRPTPPPTAESVPVETRVFSAGPNNPHSETIFGQAGQTFKGYFTISGGSTPDIIYTLRAPSGTILDQRNRAVARYDFEYRLPTTGQYVMVFDNSYSLITTKHFTLNFRLV